MRSKEVKELFTASSFEYFCEDIGSCLKGYSIDHIRMKVLLYSMIDVLHHEIHLFIKGESFKTG
jgi:hypothetical protein